MRKLYPEIHLTVFAVEAGLSGVPVKLPVNHVGAVQSNR